MMEPCWCGWRRVRGRVLEGDMERLRQLILHANRDLHRAYHLRRGLSDVPGGDAWCDTNEDLILRLLDETIQEFCDLLGTDRQSVFKDGA